MGLDNRATMDIDTTIRNYNLSTDDVRNMIGDIIAIPLDDGTKFVIKSTENIMGEAEYPGIRVKSDAINYEDLAKVFKATSKKRESYELASDLKHILKQIKFDDGLAEQWEK